MGNRRFQLLSFVVGLILLAPTLGLLAAASPSGALTAPTAAPATLGQGEAPAISLAPAATDTPAPVADTSEFATVEATSADDALRKFIERSLPRDNQDPTGPPPGEFGRVPLADTDNNSINQARWLNGSSQWTGESVNGENAGGFQRRDVDWWKFPMGNVSAGTADVFEFDIQKQPGQSLQVEVRVYATFDYDNYGSPNTYYSPYFENLNASQTWGENSHIKVTAFEANTYFLLIRNPLGSASCCMVNYSIFNVSDWTVASQPSIDDNSNRTAADVFNPAALPTNQQVLQNEDMVDVYDLTAQFSINPPAGDSARVTLNLTVDDGRTDISDFYNLSGTPGTSELPTMSVAVLLLFYPDVAGYWHSYSAAGLRGDTLRISGSLNGTPVYAAVYTYSYLGFNPFGQPYLSSVPGWNAYNFTGFWRAEDRAPVFVPSIPGIAMWEDDDASGQNLLDLAPYFTDDWDSGQLRFGVGYNQQPSLITLSFTGSMLSVQLRPAASNYWGNITIQVLGIDRGFDRTPSTADDHGTSSNYFLVNVRPVNDPPVLTEIGLRPNTHTDLVFNITQGGALVLTPTVTDLDGTAAFAFTTDVLPAFATFTPGNGTLVFTPGNADVGLHHLVETVSDGVATDSVPIMINVTNTNDNPSFVRVGGIAVSAFPHVFQATQGQLFRLSIEVQDPDWEIGVQDSINYAADKTFVAIARDASDFRFANASFTPTNAQVGQMTIWLSVGDGALGQFDDNISLTVQVQNANDAPFWVSLSTTNTWPLTGVQQLDITGFDGSVQGSLFVMTVRADDIDVANSLGDALTFTTSQPGKFTVAPKPDGVSAEVSVRPNQTDAARGYIDFDIFVDDQGLPPLRATVRVHLSVQNTNDPPVWTSVFSINLTEGEPFAMVFTATDPDGDPISYGTDSQVLIPDAQTGAIEFTPTNEYIEGADKTLDVTFFARDSHNAIASMVVHVFIRNVNFAPSNVRITSPLEDSEFDPGEGISLRGSAEDHDAADVGHLTYTWYVDGTPSGTGPTVLVNVPNPDAAPKTVQIRLMVRDQSDQATNTTVNVTVRGTPPTAPQPGFEAPLVLGALAAVAAIAAVAARRRRKE